MSFGDQLQLFSQIVVIVDDGFAPVDLNIIDSEDWASLRNAIAGEGEKWESIQIAHFPALKSAMDLKRDDADLARAWALYEANPAEFSFLDPIFKKIVAKRHVSLIPLKPIIEFLRDELHLTVCCHSNIPSASDDIRRSKLLFLDFYLYQQSTASKAIADIGAFEELLSSKVSESGVLRDRFLFLISTQLPSGSDIESFRKAAKVKAAFFKPISKGNLDKAWLIAELGRRLLRYEDLHRFSSYLDVFSKQMERVTEGLRIDLEALELHDLAILHHMRLKVDSENLGAYVSWIMSESLAARIRASAPMLAASEDVSAVNLPPLHGMLSPNQVLFELFSEISFSVAIQDSGAAKVGFGDVFVPIAIAKKEVYAPVPSQKPTTDVRKQPEPLKVVASPDTQIVKDTGGVELPLVPLRTEAAATGPQVGQDILLVIAPACDLQRPADDYDVLCVRGKVASKTPKLVDLLEQRVSLGRDKISGGFKNLLRIKEGTEANFLLLEWYPERITTVLVTQLRGNSYSRLARLNELFGQEVKEDALRQVGRIGVPVDPAFSIGLGATIAYTVRKKGVISIEVPDEYIVSGVFTSGNSSNTTTLFLSEEFIEHLDGQIVKIDAALTEVTSKFAEARAELAALAGQGLALAKNERKLAHEKFTVRYCPEFVRGTLESGFCGVCFYPRGVIKDKPEEADTDATPRVTNEERMRSPAPLAAPMSAEAIEVKDSQPEVGPMSASVNEDKSLKGGVTTSDVLSIPAKAMNANSWWNRCFNALPLRIRVLVSRQNDWNG